MLLAKIKGNKDYFGNLVPFLEEGGVCLRPTDPLDPLEVVVGGHLLENFPRGGWVSPNFKSRGGGVRPPRTPLLTSMPEELVNSHPNQKRPTFLFVSIWNNFNKINFCQRRQRRQRGQIRRYDIRGFYHCPLVVKF